MLAEPVAYFYRRVAGEGGIWHGDTVRPVESDGLMVSLHDCCIPPSETKHWWSMHKSDGYKSFKKRLADGSLVRVFYRKNINMDVVIACWTTSIMASGEGREADDEIPF